jgi:lipopolysaccharide export system protein LptA
MKRASDSHSAPVLPILLLCCCGLFMFGARSGGAAAAEQGGNKEFINIVAAKLDYYDKERKLVYTGNVVAVRGATTIKTPSLVVFLNPKESGSQPPSSSSQVRRMEAAGPVTLISRDQVATGDFGIYEKAQNKVYLNGNVSLTQGPNVTKGDHIVYDVNTAQAVVSGHVRSMLVPNSDSEEETTKKSDGEAAADKSESNTQ